MNDLEREAGHLLERYRQEEIPPAAVDFVLRARIRRAARDRRSGRWLGVCGIAAAATFLLVWALESRKPRPDEQVFFFSALRAGQIEQARVAIVRSLSDPNWQPPRPPPASVAPREPQDTLEDAVRRMDAAEHKAALELLEPCSQKVGTDALLEECEGLMIEALCRSGDLAEGQRRMVRFRGAYPDSLKTPAIARLCGD